LANEDYSTAATHPIATPRLINTAAFQVFLTALKARPKSDSSRDPLPRAPRRKVS
jgi:hypothetical protein